MTAGQNDIVQSSVEQVIPRADIVAAMFYARLFEIAPELSLSFKGNLLDQIRNLLTEQC